MRRPTTVPSDMGLIDCVDELLRARSILNCALVALYGNDDDDSQSIGTVANIALDRVDVVINGLHVILGTMRAE